MKGMLTHMPVINYPENGHVNCLQIEDQSYWFKHRNNCILSIIHRFPPSGTILDIGGGNGFVAQRMLSEGFSTTLIEPGPVGAWNAKRLRKIPDVINASFEDTTFEDDSVSAAGLFDVLEHIEEEVFLDKLWKALKPNGLIYLTVPAHNWLWSYSDIHAGHLRRYNPDMIQKLLRGKFSLKFYSYTFSVLLLPIFLFRVLPYRLKHNNNHGLLSSDIEYGSGGGILVNLISWFLNREYKNIQKGKKIPLGTSFLIVLEKINDKNPF